MSSSAQESITCTSSHRAISHETTHTRRIQQSEEWKNSSVLPLDKRISVCSQSDAHNLRLLFLTATKADTTNFAFNHFGHSIKNDPFRIYLSFTTEAGKAKKHDFRYERLAHSAAKKLGL